jgi:hypothetical protein
MNKIIISDLKRLFEKLLAVILTRREQATGNREQGGTTCFLLPSR